MRAKCFFAVGSRSANASSYGCCNSSELTGTVFTMEAIDAARTDYNATPTGCDANTDRSPTWSGVPNGRCRANGELC